MSTEMTQSGPVPFRCGFPFPHAEHLARHPAFSPCPEDGTREAGWSTLAAQCAATGIIFLLALAVNVIAAHELEILLR